MYSLTKHLHQFKLSVNLLLIFTALISLSSCEMFGIFVGDTITETRSIANFTSIDIEGAFEVEFKQMNAQEIIVEAPDNMIDNISTSVENGNLVIEDNNSFNWTRSYNYTLKIYVPICQIRQINIRDQVKISSTDTIVTDTLLIDVYSLLAETDITLNTNHFHLQIRDATGNFIVKGKANSAYLFSEEVGYIFAQDFKCQKIDVINSSTGDCHVWAEQTLNASLRSSGDIIYSGNPLNINTIEQSSSGQLLPSGIQ